jgi:MoxR-like ATPase
MAKEQDVQEMKDLYQRISASVLSVFVGQESLMRPVIIGLLSGMHVLIEDIPGVGKTTLALALARSCGLDFARIQFTPDLLPGDIIGMTVWNQELREFQFKPGAVGHQFILGDEINRASERTQSALLEAMAEGSVSVDGVSYPLPDPFFVLATQNPISFAGTFMLPESQIDRFGICSGLGYPGPEAEREILSRFQENNPLDTVEAVCTAEDIVKARKTLRSVDVRDEVKDYVIGISGATRRDPRFRLGLSPRGSRHLMLTAQALAAVGGRGFVIPEDVMDASRYVIPHRIRLSADARNADTDERSAVAEVVKAVKVPSGLR